nr:MAG TPA: hypothetical protein [Caudoviricetes sp.]
MGNLLLIKGSRCDRMDLSSGKPLAHKTIGVTCHGVPVVLFFISEFFVDFLVKPFSLCGLNFTQLFFESFHLLSFNFHCERFEFGSSFFEILGSALGWHHTHLLVTGNIIPCYGQQIKRFSKNFTLRSKRSGGLFYLIIQLLFYIHQIRGHLLMLQSCFRLVVDSL